MVIELSFIAVHVVVCTCCRGGLRRDWQRYSPPPILVERHIPSVVAFSSSLPLLLLFSSLLSNSSVLVLSTSLSPSYRLITLTSSHPPWLSPSALQSAERSRLHSYVLTYTLTRTVPLNSTRPVLTALTCYPQAIRVVKSKRPGESIQGAHPVPTGRVHAHRPPSRGLFAVDALLRFQTDVVLRQAGLPTRLEAKSKSKARLAEAHNAADELESSASRAASMLPRTSR